MSETLESLRQQVEEYRTIIDNSPLMFWYKDTNGMHLRVNRPAAALEGLPVTAIEGKSHWELYPREQAQAFQDADNEVLRSGQPKINMIEQHTSPVTGHLMWLRTSKVPYHDAAGNTIGVIAFAVDITEFKDREITVRQGIEQLEARIKAGADQSEVLARLQELRALLE